MFSGIKKFQPQWKNSSALIVPIALAAVYGSFTVHMSSAFATFVDRIGPMEALQFIGFALSAFGAIALWPALIQLGRGVPYNELQRRLRESEASVKSLESTRNELQDEVHSYAAELQTSYQRFRLVLKSFNIATFYCDREHRYEWVHNFRRDVDSIIGKKDQDILEPAAASVLADLKQRALDEEQLQEGQVVISDKGRDMRYLVQVAPRYDKHNRCIGTLSVATDITEKSLWHQHLLLMIDEVNHRARNMLTIVLSILNLTSKTASSVGEFHKKVYGRVLALSVSLSLISEDSWTASSMRRLVERIVEKSSSHSKGSIDIEGDDVFLCSKAIQNLGLAFHELLENANQHGALSELGGRVKLSWTHETDESFDGLVITWSERSSCDIKKPSRRGFGLMAIENVLFKELQGLCESTWSPEGLTIEIRLPQDMLREKSEQPKDPSQFGKETSFVIDSRTKQKIEYAA